MSADTLPPPLVQRLQSYADDADAHGKVFVPLGTVTLREIIAALAPKPPDAGDASGDPAAALLEVPRAPAVALFWPGHGAILGAAMAELIDDPDSTEDASYNQGVNRACDAAAAQMDELLARSNVTGPGKSQATPPQDEKTAPGSGP